MLRRLLELLFGIEATAEIIDREMAMEELRQEREAAWAEESLPTFGNCYGCLDCGVIQIRPRRMECTTCGSSALMDLRKQLERGHRRLDFRSRDRRDVLHFPKVR